MRRILVWGLSNSRAGTESVISNYVSNMHDVAFDFLCYEEPENFSHLYGEGTNNRAFVITMKFSNPVKYFKELKQFMKEHASEYDALWFNLNNTANVDLLVYAKRYGIKKRIGHIHNSMTGAEILIKIFSKINWNRCLNNITDRWACSDSAGKYLYGDLDYKIIPNMINSDRISYSAEAGKAIREKEGLEDKFVIGTLGRLNTQKNQHFMVELLPEILKRKPNACFVIVGEGELRDDLEQKAKSLGVEHALKIVGSQSDVKGYLSSFDVFAFPSLYEGLPLALLEAQFNGLPCVIADTIGQDAVVSNNLVRLSLSNKDEWLDSLCSMERKDDFLMEDKAKYYDMSRFDKTGEEFFDLLS